LRVDLANLPGSLPETERDPGQFANLIGFAPKNEANSRWFARAPANVFRKTRGLRRVTHERAPQTSRLPALIAQTRPPTQRPSHNCATKFALEGLTQTLQEEVEGFGIRTLIVEPGAFRTGLFRPGAAYESAEMPEYADVVGPTRAYLREGDGQQPGDPIKAAEAIVAALDADDPPLRLVLGADAIGNIRERLESLTTELAKWEDVGTATAL
jgi:NAD(P)-dependent dehydrogenase (short-subunit alcohol dehydrogenase family)